MTRRARHRRFPPARGMTLLEVVIATSAMLSITVLVAALWAQTRGWSRENAAHHAALRLDRTLNLLDEQWATRVLGVALGSADAAAAVTLTDRELTFVTTTPILHRGAPFVRVRLRIDKPAAMVVGQRALASLEYSEARVVNPAAGADDSAVRDERSIVLIEDVEDIRFERWVDESLGADATREAAGARWRGVTSAVSIAAADRSETAERADAPPPDAPPARRETDRLLAGRLIGVIEGKEVAWQFLAGPSR